MKSHVGMELGGMDDGRISRETVAAPFLGQIGVEGIIV
jgi:hypothetical protein